MKVNIMMNDSAKIGFNHSVVGLWTLTADLKVLAATRFNEFIRHKKSIIFKEFFEFSYSWAVDLGMNMCCIGKLNTK